MTNITDSEIKWLKDFTNTVPFGYESLLGVFLQMKEANINPMSGSLLEYCNFVSSLGLSLSCVDFRKK